MFILLPDIVAPIRGLVPHKLRVTALLPGHLILRRCLSSSLALPPQFGVTRPQSLRATTLLPVA